MDICYGLDVSTSQAKVDWTAVRKAGYAFCFIKASEGISYSVDRINYFAVNAKQARAAGLLLSAYHFFRANQDSSEQAANFVDVIRYAGVPLDIPPALDVETTDNTSVDMLNTRVDKWLGFVKQAFGCAPFLYSYADFLNENLDAEQFSDYRLWIASYGSNAPTGPLVPTYSPAMPQGWSDYCLWQFSDRGAVPGVTDSKGAPAPVDLNLYRDSPSKLKSYGQPMTEHTWPGYIY